MYKTILFDFDGTLVPSLDYWLDGFKYALNHLGHSMEEEVIIERCFYKNDADLIRYFGWESCELFWRLVQEHLAVKLKSPALFPGVMEVLEFCQTNKLCVGMVTSGERAVVSTALSTLSIDHHFPVVVTADDITHFKPHPEPVLQALSKLDADPAHTLFVGDYIVDVAAGKAAGTQTALFFNDAHSKFHRWEHLEASEPDFVFADYRDLLSMLSNKLAARQPPR